MNSLTPRCFNRNKGRWWQMATSRRSPNLPRCLCQTLLHCLHFSTGWLPALGQNLLSRFIYRDSLHTWKEELKWIKCQKVKKPRSGYSLLNAVWEILLAKSKLSGYLRPSFGYHTRKGCGYTRTTKQKCDTPTASSCSARETLCPCTLPVGKTSIIWGSHSLSQPADLKVQLQPQK